MKHKNNKRWTKRKHRNGKRPERTGSLKINLQPLSAPISAIDFLRVSLDLEMQHLKRMPDFPYLNKLSEIDTPEYQQKFRKYELDIKLWRQQDQHLKYILSFFSRAVDFFSNFKQVDPANLAINVINEVQPAIRKKCTVLEYFCTKCKLKNRCPMSGLSDRMKANACLFIPVTASKRQWYMPDTEKQADYSRNDTVLIAEAWEIPNN